MPVIYDKGVPTDMVTYRCDLFKDAGYGKGDNIYSKSGMQTLKNAEGEEIDKEWKNYCVVDDSSKFAAAVFYHYINKEILKDEKLENRVAYGIDLWGTSSEKFLMVSSFIKKVLKSNKFEFVVWDDIEDDDDKNSMQLKIFKLKPGDLLCRKGNVEFYIGNDRFVNWGSVHKTYSVKKEIDKEHYNYYIDSKNTLYTAFIRFKGGE